jgi:hypothetical protein
VILRQPEALLNDILEIALAAGRVRRLKEV